MTMMLAEELSHGLRTPLTSVVGFACTLIENWESFDDDQRLVFLRLVYEEALRLSHSIELVDRQIYESIAVDGARSGELKLSQS